MANLIANKNRQGKVHRRRLNVAPATAGVEYYVGAYVCVNTATGLAVRGADAANLRPLGVLVETMFPDDPDQIHHHLDNSAGADGVLQGNPEVAERVVRYDQAGEYAFEVSAGTARVGQPAFLVDDDTVSANATVNNVIAGHFTRPAPDGGWFIDISRRGIA